MEIGKPFSRKQIFKWLIDFVKDGWGSYNELIKLSVKDLLELQIAINSKAQEEEMSRALG